MKVWIHNLYWNLWDPTEHCCSYCLTLLKVDCKWLWTWAVSSRCQNSSCFKIANKIDEMGSSSFASMWSVWKPGKGDEMFTPAIANDWELFFLLILIYIKSVWICCTGWKIYWRNHPKINTKERLYLQKKCLQLCCYCFIFTTLYSKVLFHNTGPDDHRENQTSQNFYNNLYLCAYI